MFTQKNYYSYTCVGSSKALQSEKLTHPFNILCRISGTGSGTWTDDYRSASILGLHTSSHCRYGQNRGSYLFEN